MRYDRDYYRALPSSDLISHVDYGLNVNWRELAIALAERLRKAEDKIETMRYDVAAERHAGEM